MKFEQPSTVAGQIVHAEVDLPTVDGLEPVSVLNFNIRRPSTDIATAIIDSADSKAYVNILSPNSVGNSGVMGSLIVDYRPA